MEMEFLSFLSGVILLFLVIFALKDFASESHLFRSRDNEDRFIKAVEAIASSQNAEYAKKIKERKTTPFS